MSSITSPTIGLAVLPLRPLIEALLPELRPSTACARCPAALWMQQTGGPDGSLRLRAYCRETHSYSWESASVQVMDCDLVREQLQPETSAAA